MDDGALCPAHPVPGLRERKKAETREAISHAAVRLALEHGPENVRVADVAAEADVSPRTYNNYFASIAEAICAGPSDRARALAGVVLLRPVTEPLDQAIANAIVELHSNADIDRALMRMIIGAPVLRGEFFTAIVARDAALAEVIAERTGGPPGGLYPELLAATISSLTRVVSRRWMNDETADFGELLREALTMVAPIMGHPPGASHAGSGHASRKISGHQVA